MYEMLLGPEGIERTINGFVWGPIMLTLLVGFGYIMTFWSRGQQFRKLGFVFKRTIGGALKGGSKEKDGNNITPFQAMATALASTIGTGNHRRYCDRYRNGGAWGHLLDVDRSCRRYDDQVL